MAETNPNWKPFQGEIGPVKVRDNGFGFVLKDGEKDADGKDLWYNSKYKETAPAFVCTGKKVKGLYDPDHKFNEIKHLEEVVETTQSNLGTTKQDKGRPLGVKEVIDDVLEDYKYARDGMAKIIGHAPESDAETAALATVFIEVGKRYRRERY